MNEFAITTNNGTIEIEDTNDILRLSELSEDDFVYNYNEDEARDELIHLRAIENELHVQF